MAKRETIVKQAKKYFCNLSLNELGFLKKYYVFLTDEDEINSDIYKSLVLFSPSTQSNLGEKLSKRIQKHIDELVLDVTKNLDVKNTYFFSSYSSKNEIKEDLSPKIKADSKTFLCLYCSDCFTESFYASVRNALAHGNIIKSGKYYYLFAVSSKEGEKVSDFDKKLSFLLRVQKLDKLDAYISAFKKYN